MISGYFLLFLFSLCVLATENTVQESKTKEPEPFHDFKYPEDLVQAIENTAHYIIRATHPNGTFKYETIGSKGLSKLPITYNSVRHAGTIWSLTLYIKYKYYTQHDLVPIFRQIAIDTTAYLQTLIKSPYDGKQTYDNLKGMLTTAKTEKDKTHKKEFALGGSALALVTLASMKELELFDVDIELLRGIGRFILFFMDGKGVFSHQYFYPGKGFINNRTCDYYPGEAALALIKLYVVDNDMTWLEAARDILAALALKHLEENLTLVDHWYLIASQHIFQYQDIIDLPKDLIFAAAVKFAHFAIENPRENWCASNAIYEGLTAACLLFKYEYALGNTYNNKYPGLLEWVTPHLIDGTQKLMACSGPNGGIARNLRKFENDKYYVRIDYCQHTMSAWIRTYEFLYEHFDAKY